MTAAPIDPQELALAELGKQLVPTPDDLADMVSPLTLTYYAEKLLYTLTALWVAEASTDTEATPETQATKAKVLQGVTTAAGNLDAACVALGLLPPEAVGQ